MTVVHLVPAMEQGGVESVVCDLNRAVARAGWRSVVVSCGGRLAERIASDGGRHVELDLKSKNPLSYFSRALRLRRVLRALASEDPNTVVCAHSRVPAWLFVWANRPLGLKWISYAHGANSVSRYSAVMTRGDLVVAPSKFLADFLLEKYGGVSQPPRQSKSNNQTIKQSNNLKERLRVISPCVDMSRFDPACLDAAFVAEKRREWGIRPGERVVMSVGRVSPVKGFDNVIRDFAAAHRRDARLVIVGGADARRARHLADLRALAESLGVGGSVVFAGSQKKMPECLSIADEVVVGNTTKPESFGLSVAESLAMRRPVRLLREFGGAAEILAAVAAHGSADPREAVRELYGFDATAAKTIALYTEAIGARQADGDEVLV